MQQRCSCAQNVKQGLVYKLEECSIHSTWLNKEKTLCREPIDNMDRRRLLPPVALVRDPPPFTVNEQVLVYGIAETPVAGRICEDMEFRRKGTYSVELNDDRSVVHDISGTSMISADQGYLTPRSSCNFVRTVMDGIHPANPSDLLLHPPAEPIPKVQALKMMEQYSKLIYLKCESASNRATFHVRRSVLYMAFNQINDALKDAQRAIELDSTYVVVCTDSTTDSKNSRI